MVPHCSVRPSTLVQRLARSTEKPIAASPLSGWLSDRANGGVEYTSFFTLLLSVPWWVVMTIRGPIALFGSSLALSSESTSLKRNGLSYSVPAVFFLSGVLPPLTADLAAAARKVPGLGCKAMTHSIQSGAISDRFSACRRSRIWCPQFCVQSLKRRWVPVLTLVRVNVLSHHDISQWGQSSGASCYNT